mmetsp:Transcript_95979/g.280540  ORF Transcript_95979/g.280540 Transcript_95979/m.280540 type:complete len:227 (-) Transcript_95979:196-876(-)
MPGCSCSLCPSNGRAMKAQGDALCLCTRARTSESTPALRDSWDEVVLVGRLESLLQLELRKLPLGLLLHSIGPELLGLLQLLQSICSALERSQIEVLHELLELLRGDHLVLSHVVPPVASRPTHSRCRMELKELFVAHKLVILNAGWGKAFETQHVHPGNIPEAPPLQFCLGDRPQQVIRILGRCLDLVQALHELVPASPAGVHAPLGAVLVRVSGVRSAAGVGQA